MERLLEQRFGPLLEGARERLARRLFEARARSSGRLRERHQPENAMEAAMPMPNADVRLSTEELLTASARLATAELERLVLGILVLRAQRVAPSLPEREAELLQAINQGLPLAQEARYRELIAKRRAMRLTLAESDELLQLTDEAESREAERIAQLSELAQLRKTSLRSLMEELQIRPADHG